MVNISDPYSIRYPEICAVADVDGTTVELIEEFACIGGAMWAGHNYQKSPLVQSVRMVGNTQRFLLSAGKEELPLEGSYFPAGIAAVEVTGNEIGITYRGVGGGGVGATICRTEAKGVIRSKSDPCGGGREAGAQIWLPRRERVIIGVDDTDTPEEGATWTLAHNIAEAVQTPETRYISHTIVQLFPVPYRTKNCVGVACEFATSEPEQLVTTFEELLRKYTLSDETGMAVFRGFSSEPLTEYGWKVKRGEVTRDDLNAIREHIEIRLDGRGIIGAAAAIPFSTRYKEALSICTGET